ncbi:hypothetical protein [Streptomyces coeruleorubidus]|uniref:hypothetical protein n=1 Tax=Streptomyces coeruleorubidus TaxID=116188 RepID=UPI0033BE3CCB
MSDEPMVRARLVVTAVDYDAALHFCRDVLDVPEGGSSGGAGGDPRSGPGGRPRG